MHTTNYDWQIELLQFQRCRASYWQIGADICWLTLTCLVTLLVNDSYFLTFQSEYRTFIWAHHWQFSKRFYYIWKPSGSSTYRKFELCRFYSNPDGFVSVYLYLYPQSTSSSWHLKTRKSLPQKEKIFKSPFDRCSRHITLLLPATHP